MFQNREVCFTVIWPLIMAVISLYNTGPWGHFYTLSLIIFIFVGPWESASRSCIPRSGIPRYFLRISFPRSSILWNGIPRSNDPWSGIQRSSDPWSSIPTSGIPRSGIPRSGIPMWFLRSCFPRCCIPNSSFSGSSIQWAVFEVFQWAVVWMFVFTSDQISSL